MVTTIKWMMSKETNKFINNSLVKTKESKAVFFLSKKETLRHMEDTLDDPNVQEWWTLTLQKVRKEIYLKILKIWIFLVKSVLGTKLLPNFFDCNPRHFVCLIDCSVKCVDYLQMIGRIREWEIIWLLMLVARLKELW